MRLPRPRLGVALLLCLCAVPRVNAQKKPAPQFRITGLVVNSRDNSPVRRCTMSASLVGGGGDRRGGRREPLLATTDETGHFSLDVPSAGNWELFASAHTIRSQPLDNHDGYFTGIILTPQTPALEVVFHAVPDALMTGTVTDESGDPVRNAQVTLYSPNFDAASDGGPAMQQHGNAQTDDRGHFEIAGLDPGPYKVQVQGRPWYASDGPQAGAKTSDPSLDVVYPATWFPGVTDPSSATTLIAHPGDILQADLRLSAQPAAHLLVPSPGQQAPPGIRPGFQNPSVARLQPDGTMQQVFAQISRTPGGDLDISGLAPGTYQLTLPGSPTQTTIVRVQGGSSLALSAAPPETQVTIAVDGAPDTEPSQISLVDRTTGQTFSSNDRPIGRPFGLAAQGPVAPGFRGAQSSSRGRPGARARPRTSEENAEATFSVPPGQYDVIVQASSSAFVTGITATHGARAIGRSVTIPEGTGRLAIHLASGFATVSGLASTGGKPLAGALVLLVPATLGDPASLTVLRRDQTNSDGSFHLDRVIPGQYILVAIDHGWALHWTDAAILQPYLMQGTPLDLHSAATVNPKLAAVAP